MNFFLILFMCYFYVRFNGKRNLKRCIHMGEGVFFFPNLNWKHVRRRSTAPDMGRQAWHPCMEDSPDKCEQLYRTPAWDKAIPWQWWITTSPLHKHVSTLAKSGTLSKSQKWPNFSQSWPIWLNAASFPNEAFPFLLLHNDIISLPPPNYQKQAQTLS